MTCAHVLGLIDAGPFADYPRAHLDAAWQHARQCATCGSALQAATVLTADLAALPQPAVPPDLTAAVLTRLAQTDHARSAGVAATMRQTDVSSSADGWPAWATSLGALGVVIVVWIAADERAAMDIVSQTTSAIVLAASLGLYIAGLFAPLAGRSGTVTD